MIHHCLYIHHVIDEAIIVSRCPVVGMSVPREIDGSQFDVMIGQQWRQVPKARGVVQPAMQGKYFVCIACAPLQGGNVAKASFKIEGFGGLHKSSR